ncbi:cortical cell-delineating protein-like [Nymphaea colorata]|nr:cortical cell-delineating protein-like [Nymphaea colorata]
MASKVIPSLLVALVLIQCAAACEPSCENPPVYKPPVYKPPVYKPPVYKPHYPAYPHCPVDALKLGVCVDLLHGLLNLVIGHPPSGSDCCPLIKGLVDLEAAACLCTAIKADILGIHVDLDVKLTLLANTCGCSIPDGYKCA